MIAKKRKLKIENKISAFNLSGLEEERSVYEESKVGQTDELHIDEECDIFMQ